MNEIVGDGNDCRSMERSMAYQSEQCIRFLWERVSANDTRFLEVLKEVGRRFEQNTQQWDDYLVSLAVLPICVCWKYQFRPGENDEFTELNKLRQNYINKARLIDYLVPANKPFNYNLFLDSKEGQNPDANLSKAFLGLVKELFPKVPDLQVYGREEDVWIAWEFQHLEYSMLTSGILTGKPKPFNKKVSQQTIRELASFLENADSWKPDFNTIENEGELDAGEAVYTFAALEAQKNPSFYDCNAYKQFIKKLRAWGRITSPSYTVERFENGKRVPTGRNASREPRRVGL